MVRRPSPTVPAGLLAPRPLWALAVLSFGLGDVVTTTAALGVDGTVEVGPVTAPLVERFGLRVMVPLKLLVLGAGYGCWRTVPAAYRDGIPLGLAGLGLTVTAWNLAVLFRALP